MTCGHSSRNSSAASCSPRSRTSWPPTVFATAVARNRPPRRRDLVAVDRYPAESRRRRGLNLALTPTGTLTKRQQKKERFVAHYVGTYTVGAGRTSTEASQTFITAAGTANTMLHSDIQMLLITPNARTAWHSDRWRQSRSSTAISTRNSALGLDLSAPIQNVDRGGRPDYFSIRDPRPKHQLRNIRRGFRRGNAEHSLHPVRQTHSWRDQPGNGDRHDPRSDLLGQHQLHPPQLQYRSLSDVGADSHSRRLIRRARSCARAAAAGLPARRTHRGSRGACPLSANGSRRAAFESRVCRMYSKDMLDYRRLGALLHRHWTAPEMPCR